jgi:putative ABC transport system permease protein
MKYFGRTNVLNETLLLETESEGKKIHKITGVFDDLPRTSITEFGPKIDYYRIYVPIIKPKLYRPWDENLDSWDMVYGYIGFIKLREGVSSVDVDKALNELVKKHAPANFQGKLAYRTEQVSKFHFSKSKGVLYKLMVTISIITAFILMMAIINFVNLSIGNSANRLKEIGLRKTLGGNKQQLISQFLSESLIITCISSLVALVIYELLKTNFEEIFESQLPSVHQFSTSFFLYAVAFTLSIGIMVGLYPAFILSRYKISAAVKGRLFAIEGKVSLRKILIVVQITLAVTTVSAALLVSKQIDFIFSKDLGYDSKDILVVKGFPRPQTEEALEKIRNYRNEFQKIPGIESISITYPTPTGGLTGTDNFRSAKQAPSESVQLSNAFVDEHFQKNDIVINESAAKLFGIKVLEGSSLRVSWNEEIYPVKGIVKDFHFNSLHDAIKPMVFTHSKQYNFYRNLCFKLKTKDKAKTIAAIKLKYEELFPGSPFDQVFFEDDYNGLYIEEFKLQKAATIAVVLSMIIVIIGIIGIVSLNTAKRRKELGIRKVQGASSLSIVWLFIKEFLPIILIANVLAWIMTYFFIDKWLQNFAYRIDLIENLWIFLLAGIALSLITIITISIQTLKTALENPIESLRDE